MTVDLSILTPQDTVSAGTDTLATVEGLVGSDGDDTLTGDGGANSLDGVLGDDLLRGNGGDDTIDGGAGEDTADYSTAPSGVAVDLSRQGAQPTGGAGSDSLAAIQNLIGSPHADTLVSGAGSNVIDAGDGDDIVQTVDSDADEAICGAGNDSANADTLDSVDPDCETVTLGTPGGGGGGGGGGGEPRPGPAGPDRSFVLGPQGAEHARRRGRGDHLHRIRARTDHAQVRAGPDRPARARQVRRARRRATRRKRTCRRYLNAGTLTAHDRSRRPGGAHVPGPDQRPAAEGGPLPGDRLRQRTWRVTAHAC